jgi:DNA-binding MarR family transcriptional regulator
MKRTTADTVLTHLAPMTYYRPCDVAREMGIPPSSAGAALRELSGGGLIERYRDHRRTLYLTKQRALFK